MSEPGTSCGWLAPKGKSIRALLWHTPLGEAWLAFRIAGTLFGRMWQSLAKPYDDIQARLCGLAAELDPRTTTEMIGEWETSVSLPDACLPNARTLAERRAWILWRLTKKRWNTLQDWHDLAALFGLTVRITPGWLVQEPALYDAKYPKRYDRFPKLGRFRVYIDVMGQKWRGYPYAQPYVAGDNYPIWYGSGGDTSGFRCLIERVAPANILIIWNEFPPISPNGNGVTFTDDFDTEFS